MSRLLENLRANRDRAQRRLELKGNQLSDYRRSLLNQRIRLSNRRIERATADDDTFLGIDIGRRVDERDAERLFETLTSRFSQIADDQNVALREQTRLLRRNYRNQRSSAREQTRLQRQLLTAQRFGLREQRNQEQQNAIIAARENRLLQNFNANQLSRQRDDYIKAQSQQSFFLRNALRELIS